jgi:hypothetical protein
VPLPLVTTNAVIKCSHGGQVTITPRPGRLVAQVGTVLCEGDLVGAPIVGCVQPATTNTKPCTTVVSTAPGVSTTPKLLVGGRPAYTNALTGITDGVPPGLLQVVSPGQAHIVA